MMRRLALAAALFVSALVPAALAGATGASPDTHDLLETRLRAALQAVDRGAGSTPAAGRHTRQLGELAIPGVNGDVFAFGSHAYVGAWGFPCDGRGVTVVDVSDPAAPVRVASAAGYPGTSAEDMQVLHVDTGHFTGDLLAVGIQPCDESGFGGLALWDVTDPASPTELGIFPNLGVHELALTRRADGVFALLAVPFSEPLTDLVLGDAVGDFQLVDVSDPTQPVLADDWGAAKDGGFPAGLPDFPPPYDCSDPLCRGDFPAIFAHSASASSDGRTAYVAYWDLGGIVLDLTDPSDVRYRGRTAYPTGSDGDTHSAVANAAGTLLATTDEDFSPTVFHHAVGDTWGFARLWSLADPARPAHLADVTTEHSQTTSVSGFYSAHNPQFDGSRLYLSWYSDGLRVFDVSTPTAPREVASYRPQAAAGIFTRNPVPLVWGAYKAGDRIYLSDMFGGLSIVTEK